MEIVHDFRQQFLGFFLAGNVLELDAGSGLDVDLGIALAHAEHHGTVAAAHTLCHFLVEEVEHQQHQGNGQHVADQDVQQRTGAAVDLRFKLCTGGVQPVDEFRIVQGAGLVYLLFVLVSKCDLTAFDLDRADFLVLCHADECVVADFLDASLEQVREHKCLKQHEHT